MLQKNNILALAAIFAFSGCASADYMNNRDSITLGAGNATQANIGIHTIDPFPPSAKNTKIEVTGKKVGDAYSRYLSPCDPDVVSCSVDTSGGQVSSVNEAQAQ